MIPIALVVFCVLAAISTVLELVAVERRRRRLDLLRPEHDREIARRDRRESRS